MNSDELKSLTTSPPSSPLEAQASSAYTNTGRWFLGIVCAQVVLLLAIMGANAYTLATGTEVLLPTTLVDPWDMFRGNYMTLGYEISLVDCQKPLSVDDTVYVVLKRPNTNSKWIADRVEKSPPELAQGEVFIKGKVDWKSTSTTYDNQRNESTVKQQAHIHYGIEQYYIPEGTGTAAQRSTPNVLVAIDKSGNPAIKKLVQ